ncbi:phosphotransferase [Streptomyces sp. NPDC048511]|uniref:phosphotransferase n=1 Tax=Streptomyces sp. NPDC048511 TaxID=3365562 RepID=UPI003714E14D
MRWGDLAEAAERAPAIRAAWTRLHDRLQELAARVSPRTEHGLVHGELGPDHVLVDTSGRPVLIDIEGLMFFDVEWEHVFLQLRFGEQYPTLSRPGLDPARLGLFMLAMRLSLVAGPLRLLAATSLTARSCRGSLSTTRLRRWPYWFSNTVQGADVPLTGQPLWRALGLRVRGTAVPLPSTLMSRLIVTWRGTIDHCCFLEMAVSLRCAKPSSPWS